MKTGEKKILVLLTVITVLLAAAVVVLRFMNDRTGPVVTVKSDLTYHNGITEEELLDQGIKPNTIRLSIGTENVDDIIQDLDEAFKAIK